MPAAVPPPLARLAELLQCPHCGLALMSRPGALACARGHHHDVAREGYVALLDGPVGRAAGDDAAMIAARAEIERAGHFAPLDAAIVELARADAPTGLDFTVPIGASKSNASLTVDLGAGTGRLLEAVMRETGRSLGLAIDVSRAACRRAARDHPSLAVVRADVWSQIPLRDGTVDLALNSFAPRDGRELARVVRPGGTLIVANAAEGHLRELRDLHTLSIHPDKAARMRQQLGPWFEEVATRTIAWQLMLAGSEASELLRMGPTARHLRPDALERLGGSTDPILVSAAVDLAAFRRVELG